MGTLGARVYTINVLCKHIKNFLFSTENFQFLQLIISLYIAWANAHNKSSDNQKEIRPCSYMSKNFKGTCVQT